jgi:hypothetical protein
MKIGDLVYYDEMGKYAVIIKAIKGSAPLLYKLLMDDGEGGYAYRSDIVLVKSTKPDKK